MCATGLNGMEPVVAMALSTGLVWLTGNPYIRFLQQRYMGQYIREDGPQAHQSKAGTPTMGGVLIHMALVVTMAVLWLGAPHLRSVASLLAVGVLLLFGLLGGTDDYLKIAKKKNKGLSGYSKLAVQTLVGLGIGVWMMMAHHHSSVSLFGWMTVDLGWFYPVLAMLVINGASNAVNLTDGLDGLAAGSMIIALFGLGCLFYLTAQWDLLAVVLALIGACAGFLFFNQNPARVFMGDTGSLALGGALGALAVLGRVEIWLILLGIVFVLEALSVILQVISFKTTGRRIFRMSPLHHHFELGGMSEVRVVYLFWGVQLAGVLLTLWLFGTMRG
ncbi:MAG: phospho-N-acetylmuramoyl-pentapeptide-transferase [Candidatus Melainabacteria bacterium]